MNAVGTPKPGVNSADKSANKAVYACPLSNASKSFTQLHCLHMCSSPPLDTVYYSLLMICVCSRNHTKSVKGHTSVKMSEYICINTLNTVVAGLQVPHGSLGKGSGTPKNLARSHVLVAKVLTNSDAHGRIILPRVSVEANLTFLMGYRQVTATVTCSDIHR